MLTITYLQESFKTFNTYRGYGDTERPPNKKDYHLDKLTQDIAELIPALGYSSCVLVAHDWGGTVGWYGEMYINIICNHFLQGISSESSRVGQLVHCHEYCSYQVSLFVEPYSNYHFDSYAIQGYYTSANFPE